MVAHNRARHSDGVGPVKWDPDLESYARDYASRQTGEFRDLTQSGGEYGVNIFWGRGGRYTARDAVDAWVLEKKHYNYGATVVRQARNVGTTLRWSGPIR